MFEVTTFYTYYAHTPYTTAEAGLRRAESEVRKAHATHLHQSGAIASLQSEVNRIKSQRVQPIRQGNRSSSEKVQEGLKKFYRRNSTVHSTFNDKDTNLGEIRIPIALIKEKKKQEEGEEAQKANHSVKVPVRIKSLSEISRLNGNTYCRKILLSGSPGTGKSTFCQQAAYLWAAGEAWQDCTHLFVVPLRNLTEAYSSSEYFLENILAKECFLPSSLEEQIQLPADIGEVLKNELNKVMIILDGYDEMAKMPEPIRAQLFDRDAVPYMIITSQPHATHNLRRKVDAVIEPHFTDDDIEEAIKDYYAPDSRSPRKAKANDKATDLIAFLKEHPAWFELARGPLLREVLCMLWADPQKNSVFSGDVNEIELMEKAAELMFSRHLVKPCVCPTDYENRKQVFSLALGKIALEMSKQEQYLINEGIVKGCLNGSGIDVRELHEAGFLQINGVQNGNDRSISFPHSLFQEYFASLYLVTEGPRVYKEVMKTHKCPLNMQRIWVGCATLLGRERPGEREKDYHRRALEFFTPLCKEGQEEFNESYHNTLFILCLNGFEDVGGLYDKIDNKFGELTIFCEERAERLKGTEAEWQCTSVLRYLVDRKLLKDHWVKESGYYCFRINPLMQALNSLIKKDCYIVIKMQNK